MAQKVSEVSTRESYSLLINVLEDKDESPIIKNEALDFLRYSNYQHELLLYLSQMIISVHENDLMKTYALQHYIYLLDELGFTNFAKDDAQILLSQLTKHRDEEIRIRALRGLGLLFNEVAFATANSWLKNKAAHTAGEHAVALYQSRNRNSDIITPDPTRARCSSVRCAATVQTWPYGRHEQALLKEGESLTLVKPKASSEGVTSIAKRREPY